MQKTTDKSPVIICLRRLAELVISSAACSALVTVLNYFSILINYTYVFIGLFIGTVCFVLLNYILQRKYYFMCEGDNKRYIPTLAAYVIFAALTVITYKMRYDIFVWLFAITKTLHLITKDITEPVAICVFHTVSFTLFATSHIAIKEIVAIEKENERVSMEEAKNVMKKQ